MESIVIKRRVLHRRRTLFFALKSQFKACAQMNQILMVAGILNFSIVYFPGGKYGKQHGTALNLQNSEN